MAQDWNPPRSIGWRLGAALGLLLFVPIALRAQETNWHLAAEAVSDVPVHMGGRVELLAPYRIRLATSLGALPGFYVDLINQICVAADLYDQADATLMKTVMTNSLVWQVRGGWQPFAGLGLYLDLGYNLVSTGGALTAEDILSLSTKIPQLPITIIPRRSYEVSSMLHLIGVELGWKWTLWDSLTLRAAAGCLFVVGASTSVTPRYEAPTVLEEMLVRKYTQQVADSMDSTYRSVITPLVSLAIGYQFF